MKPAPMPPDYLEAAQHIAQKIAAKASWRARNRRGHTTDTEDLEQQCLLYCLEIYRKGGWHDGIEGYRKICWAHCFRRVGLYRTRQQAPVTCGRDSEVQKQLPRTIASLKSEVMLDSVGVNNARDWNHGAARDGSSDKPHANNSARRVASYFFDVLSSPPSQERETEVENVRAKIRARMTVLGGDAPGTWEALAGWLDDVDPAEAVASTGTPLAAVYGANKRFARVAREDMTLRSLALALALARGMAVDDEAEYVGVA